MSSEMVPISRRSQGLNRCCTLNCVGKTNTFTGWKPLHIVRRYKLYVAKAAEPTAGADEQHMPTGTLMCNGATRLRRGNGADANDVFSDFVRASRQCAQCCC